MVVDQNFQQNAAARFPLRFLSARCFQILGLLLLGFVGVVPSAAAHHLMGGRVPANFFEGFLSGLAHPVIGLDHLAFVVAIGLLSIKQARGALIPLFFVVAAMAGTGLHVMRVDLPLDEIAIALSVIALGVFLALGKQLSFPVLAGLAAIAGLFHGYAFGESIVGAEMSPLVAYLLGFSAIQYVIAFLAFWLGGKLQNNPERSAPFLRYFGYAICMLGVVFLSNSLHAIG